jgi:uncharacterized protein YcfL
MTHNNNKNQVIKIRKPRARLLCVGCGTHIRTGKSGNRSLVMRHHCIHCEIKITKENRSLWQRIKDLFQRG